MTETKSMSVNLLLEPGILQEKVVAQTRHALQCGALLSIPTEYEWITQSNIRFIVRILANLARKEQAKQQQDKAETAGKSANPFLPYDQDLFVANLSDTHVCLLNKFNVVEHHILMITRTFEAQESLLTLHDFAAMWVCLAEIDGLAFYNGGKVAGASQSHKHLQLVPYLLSAEEPQIPIESALYSVESEETIAVVPDLPFVHAFTRCDLEWVNSPVEAAAATLDRYHALLHAVGLPIPVDTTGCHPGVYYPGAYNLLVTRRWMFLVPRSQESFADIQANSLGFAGALLVRNQTQLQTIKELGPLDFLKQVGVSHPHARTE